MCVRDFAGHYATHRCAVGNVNRMSDDVLIRCENVGKKFCRDLKKSLWYGVKDATSDFFGGRSTEDHETLRNGEFWANQQISLELKRGECLGLIGRNGAGKTTLLKMLSGLIKPDVGLINMRGRVGALIALGAGFNPILTGRENVFVNGKVLGLSRADIRRQFDEIVEFAELEDFIDSPLRSYSSGMQVRLGFAIASTLRPNVLLVDEVLAVGDSRFRFKCYERIFSLKKDHGTSIVLVTHQMVDIERVCDDAILLGKGKVVFKGNAFDATQEYFSENYQAAAGIDLNGFGPITVEFKNTSEQVIDDVNGGEDLHVDISVLSTKKIDRARLFVRIDDALGESVFGMSTRVAEFIPSVTPPKTRIRLSIPDLPLMAGKYVVFLALYDDATGEVVTQNPTAKVLKVVSPSQDRFGCGLVGKVTVNHDWSYLA